MDTKNQKFQHELKRMLLDIKAYPCTIHDLYKDVYWEMKRPCGTYWCLYIYPNKSIFTDKHKIYEIIHNNTYSDIIYINDGNIWIDFAHYYDFAPPSMDPNELNFYRNYGTRRCNYTYKDYNYVKNIMMKVIEHILKVYSSN